ncbi:MAG: 2-phospho-L-lactate transferase, partial [Actinomycetota bacterium]|nr:2-phospho-L-lactate transferase [Actinomycetota bacterium]
HYGARTAGGLLDGWLIHVSDAADIPGIDVSAVPLFMTDDEASAAMVRTALKLVR